MHSILIVEDDEPIREILVEVIRDAGYEVEEAATADAAVDALNDPLLRLLLTDINLPGQRDGVDLAIEARQARPELPIILISGRPAGMANASHIEGSVEFMAKPFSLTKLVDMIDKLTLAT